mmetsp:Transcript_115128/g.257140  ORF Transcript_115128/g.257140 Transcript_115128/m.257140 type:complete len:203 (+) Transcript_115128:2140-2748(+)
MGWRTIAQRSASRISSGSTLPSRTAAKLCVDIMVPHGILPSMCCSALPTSRGSKLRRASELATTGSSATTPVARRPAPVLGAGAREVARLRGQGAQGTQAAAEVTERRTSTARAATQASNKNASVSARAPGRALGTGGSASPAAATPRRKTAMPARPLMLRKRLFPTATGAAWPCSVATSKGHPPAPVMLPVPGRSGCKSPP